MEIVFEREKQELVLKIHTFDGRKDVKDLFFKNRVESSDRSWETDSQWWTLIVEINVKKQFIYKCYRLTHRKQQKLELWI